MNSKLILIILILILSVILRFWNLGDIPVSPDWDEAALGYNAYSILHTGKDEFGKSFPIVLESFGDYKPALYVYLIIPFILIFDLTVVAVRFPSAILGVFSVMATFFIVKELFKNEKITYLVTFLLAISPWHIQFSRIAFEANLGLSLNLFAILFFLLGLRNKWGIILASIFSALSIYSYQSEKLFVPMLGLVMIFLFREELKSISRKYLVTALFVGIILSMPIILNSVFNPESLSRAKSTSFMNNPSKILNNVHYNNVLNNEINNDYLGKVLDNRRVVYIKTIASNYIIHFDLNYLFVTGDKNQRHHPSGIGHLYLLELPFFLLGIYFLVFGLFNKKIKIFLLSWLLIAPIPASLTWDVPSAVRTLNMLPVPQIITGLGFISLFQRFKIKKNFQVIFFIILSIGISLNFVYFLNQYFSQYKVTSAFYWQYGYSEIVKFTEENKDKYDKVVVGSVREPLDQSYIFFLFYSKYPPSQYQKIWENDSSRSEALSFDKYVFYDYNWSKIDKKNILFIGTDKWIPDGARIKYEVTYPDGRRGFLAATEE